MQLTFRWFGEQDAIPLAHIAQIPGIGGVVTSLMDIPAGEVWAPERVKAMREAVVGADLTCEVVESVNIHESIKLGTSDRDRRIENYVTTLRNLHEIGVKCVCYNFMPVLDWVRSELHHALPDGSDTMYFSREYFKTATPSQLAERYAEQCGGIALPGWEPERLRYINDTVEQYKNVSREQLRANAKYFLDAVIPYAERYDVKLAVHPDDPPFEIFGLHRLVNNAEGIEKWLALNNSPYNGLTLCTGSLGCDASNDVCEIIKRSAGRIHFAHIRNLKLLPDGDFCETSHPTDCGSLNMPEIVRTLKESGFDGCIRPDHGRMIWGESGRPGYGLFDRALGLAYLNGLWEAI
jgi:mannonate dehydratase